MHRTVIKTVCKPFQMFFLESKDFREVLVLKYLKWFADRFDYISVHKTLASVQFARVLNWPFWTG